MFQPFEDFQPKYNGDKTKVTITRVCVETEFCLLAQNLRLIRH
jgi:hypothetical protein